ncbi:MAG: hypothetical protein DI604_34570, partial [Delftia acidovorans]
MTSLNKKSPSDGAYSRIIYFVTPTMWIHQMEEKTEFFKNLQKLIEDLRIKGVTEVKTIALVYQVAFKMIEHTDRLKPPIFYSYTDLNFNKELAKIFQDEIQKCSARLLLAIKESEAFSDLVAEFIEKNEASNKNLGQYFTPKDVSLFQSAINLKLTSIDRFKEDDYFWIGDDTGCGTGSLILSMLSQFKDNVKDFEDIHFQSVAVSMNDIDEYLSKIAYFQVVLSSLIHKKPLGIVQVEAKDIISEYQITKNQNIFISNMTKA